MDKTRTIYEKLLAVQKEIKPIKKDSENPFFKSLYFDINSLLAEVKPILNKHGLLLLQGLNEDNGRILLDTQIVDVENGDKVSFNTVLPEASDAQKQGSVITYFRRYAIQSLLSLEAEDDDGNSAKNDNPPVGAVYAGKPASPFKKASPKQINFIKKLANEKGERIDGVDDFDSVQASEMITKLMAKPTVSENGHFEAEDFIPQD